MIRGVDEDAFCQTVADTLAETYPNVASEHSVVFQKHADGRITVESPWPPELWITSGVLGAAYPHWVTTYLTKNKRGFVPGTLVWFLVKPGKIYRLREYVEPQDYWIADRIDRFPEGSTLASIHQPRGE